jgi:hypothetical protein
MDTAEIKDEKILFRISTQKKNDWKKICQKKNISLTSLIINSVDKRIMDDERRIILSFIESQDNVFVKIETNINQIAKITNSQKFISPTALEDFTKRLTEIAILKQEQNKIFENIYAELSK